MSHKAKRFLQFNIVNSMKEEIAQRIFWPVFIGAIVFIIIKYLVIDSVNLKRNHRYTIATVSKIYSVSEGPRSADFDYYVNYKHYSGPGDISNVKRNINLGDRVYIEFYIKNPNNAKVLLQYVVPDSIDESPINGWDSLPRLINIPT
jgi:hypothetical protein